MTDNDYRYLGNFSAVEPVYTRLMCCHDCKTEWHGCWDNFMCPECGNGELPHSDIGILTSLTHKSD